MAAWLRELLRAGVIADGEIDTRSIVDVRADDLSGFTHCHFFAGIGGWAYAARLAGWSESRALWTGSCPCQPFSVAGTSAGIDDPRHLWPAWFRLITQCRPRCVFGEQVAGRAGRYWLDLVWAALEGINYAVGAFDLPACSLGAPHRRQRLWFVADDHRARWPALTPQQLGDASRPRLEGHAGDVAHGHESGWHAASAVGPSATASALGAAWHEPDWIVCTDGTARPVESGSFPLAHGIPARVGRLRGYGNAIVPHVGATLLRAYLDLTP